MIEQFPVLEGKTLDSSQKNALTRLSQLLGDIDSFLLEKKRWFHFIKSQNASVKGVWLHGSVGTGKSLLMDAFFNSLKTNRKKRVHFHELMLSIHRGLHQANKQEDPLKQVAMKLKEQCDVICLDEFHVSNIADAMVLGRFLNALFSHQIIFCVTSNQSPDFLYLNGLHRERFLPVIDFLNDKFDVLEVNSGKDYRRFGHLHSCIFFTPSGKEADLNLDQIFSEMGVETVQENLLLNGRQVKFYKRADRVIWFRFQDICERSFAQIDYLELIQLFDHFIISDVPILSAEKSDVAKRLTWLVDILYDHHKKLFLSLQDSVEKIYTSGIHSEAFKRTVSRLIEMQSHEYFIQP